MATYTIQRLNSHGIAGAGWSEFWTGRGWSEEYPDARKFGNLHEAQEHYQKQVSAGKIERSGATIEREE